MAGHRSRRESTTGSSARRGRFSGLSASSSSAMEQMLRPPRAPEALVTAITPQNARQRRRTPAGVAAACSTGSTQRESERTHIPGDAAIASRRTGLVHRGRHGNGSSTLSPDYRRARARSNNHPEVSRTASARLASVTPRIPDRSGLSSSISRSLLTEVDARPDEDPVCGLQGRTRSMRVEGSARVETAAAGDRGRSRARSTEQRTAPWRSPASSRRRRRWAENYIPASTSSLAPPERVPASERSPRRGVRAVTEKALTDQYGGHPATRGTCHGGRSRRGRGSFLHDRLRARRCSDTTSELGVPLIVDEIRPAGRTGTCSRSAHESFRSDTRIQSSRGMRGMPIAVVSTTRTRPVRRPGAHTGTFRGYPARARGGRRRSRQIFPAGRDLAETCASRARTTTARLRELESGHDCVGDVRGDRRYRIEIVDPSTGEAGRSVRS